MRRGGTPREGFPIWQGKFPDAWRNDHVVARAMDLALGPGNAGEKDSDAVFADGGR